MSDNVKAVIVVLVLLGSLIGYPVLYYTSAEGASFTVIDKERVSSGSGDSLTHKYLIYSEEETFEVTDTILFLKWDASDRYGHLKKDRTYKVTVAGWRVPFLSWYRNIISITEVNAKWRREK